MTTEEFEHEIGRVKRVRAARASDPTDAGARASFERDFAAPVDDARLHMPDDEAIWRSRRRAWTDAE